MYLGPLWDLRVDLSVLPFHGKMKKIFIKELEGFQRLYIVLQNKDQDSFRSFIITLTKYRFPEKLTR